jgi:hypothetical protein
MRHAYPFILESEARPKRLQRKRIVALAPLVLIAWFAYWLGMVSQACCLPLFSDAHHVNPISGTGDHHAHHEGALAAHEPATPMDQEHCPQLKCADELVPASMGTLTIGAQQPVLLALLSPAIPLSIFSNPSILTLYQQAHPPPSPYLRTRRLLI